MNTQTRDTPPAMAALFAPYRLGAVSIPNRIVMAPMTRSMAGPGLVPTQAMADYYARRADAGLIVTEATIIRPDGQGYPDTPGLFSEAQIEGWHDVTHRVHDAGGRIFAQLWHVGRVSHPTYLDGNRPIAPSAVALEGRLPRSDELTYGTPRALEADEIPALIEAYADAAANALEAEFDGVEIHGANGYLIDQFLHGSTNRRDDDWGGSPEKRTRFALAVVDAVSARVSSGRTGLRLSPGAYFNMSPHDEDAAVFQHLLTQLASRNLAYLHTGVFDDGTTFDTLGGRTASAFLRAHYDGTLIANGSYTPEAAAAAVESGAADLVALGRPFIANPDLVRKLRRGDPLTPYDADMLATLD